MVRIKSIFRLSLISFFVFFYINFVNAQCGLLCNSDFEDIQNSPSVIIVDTSMVPCWGTTASDNMIEVWHNGFNGVPSYSGNQFVELNAYFVSTLFQNFTVPSGTSLTISFAHRGRAGIDTMSVSIGAAGGPFVTLGKFGDGNTAWGYHTVNYVIPAGLGGNYSLRFNSIYASGGNQAIGNFLDDVKVEITSTATLNISSTSVSCYGLSDGSAQATLIGGSPPYTYSWLPTGGTASMASSLSAGTYTVNVTDSLGCSTSSTTFVTEPSSLLVNIIPTNVNCETGESNGSATAIVTGGAGAYTYHWLPSGGNNNHAEGLSIGSYSVVVMDANSCIEDDQVVIGTDKSIDLLSLPDIFTPNKDGINDKLDFSDSKTCDKFSITIFNRWGGKVFYASDFKSKSWDGKHFDGSDVSDGTYFYILEGTSQRYRMAVTVMR